MMFRALQATGSVVVAAASRGLSTSTSSSTATAASTVTSFFSRLPVGVKYTAAAVVVAETGAACYLSTHPDVTERLKNAMFS